MKTNKAQTDNEIENKIISSEQKESSASYFNAMSIFAYMGEEFGDEK